MTLYYNWCIIVAIQSVMPPRQDLVPATPVIKVEQTRVPPPPAPGRLQRPPHDNPAVYLHRPPPPRINVTRVPNAQ